VPPPERGAIGDAGPLPRFTFGVDGEEPLKDGSPPESLEKEDMPSQFSLFLVIKCSYKNE
jgi:hypothetical protein